MKGTQSIGIRILLGFVSFLLCICLFVTAIAAITILDVRVITGKQQLQNLISDTLFSPVAARTVSAPGRIGTAGAAVQPASVRLAARRLAEITQKESTDKQILRWAYDAVKAEFGEQLMFSYEQVEGFFDRSTVKDFLAEKIASVINDMYNGTSTTTITETEIRQQLNGNKALIAECFSFELTDEAVNYAVEWVMNSGILSYLKPENLEIILNGGSVEDIVGGSDANSPGSGSVSGSVGGESAGDPGSIGGGSGSSSSAGKTESIGAILGSIINGTGEPVGIPAILALVRGLTSVTVLVGVLSAAVILIGLLFLVNLRRVHVALVDSGITIFLAGGLMLLPVALSGFLTTLLPDPAGILIQKLLQMTAVVSGAATGLGLVLVIGGIIVGSVRKKKALAAEA